MRPGRSQTYVGPPLLACGARTRQYPKIRLTQGEVKIGMVSESIVKVLNRTFGPLILHEITAHKFEQWKRERLAGKWRGQSQTSAPRPQCS